MYHVYKVSPSPGSGQPTNHASIGSRVGSFTAWVNLKILDSSINLVHPLFLEEVGVIALVFQSISRQSKILRVIFVSWGM